VIFKRHYSTNSDSDIGTLFADRNLINRRNVSADVHSNWANCKSFALLEIKARIVATAMEVLGMEKIEDQPSNFSITDGLKNGSALLKLLYLDKISSQIVDQFVIDEHALEYLTNNILTSQEKEDILNNQQLTADGRFPCRVPGCGKSFKYDGKRRRDHELTHNLPHVLQEPITVTSECPKKITSTTKCDDVFNYNCSFLNQGLLFMNFLDATSEGDGERAIRCWKFFLLHFKEEKSTTKYSLEALYLLFQLNSLLPPEQAHSLMWNRTVNNKGGLGKNVSLDLDLEHDNNYLKQAIKNLGPNVTPAAVMRISHSQNVSKELLNKFGKECNVKSKSGKHVAADYSKDLHTIVKSLVEERIFVYTPGRQYAYFPDFRRDPLSRLDIRKMFHWINKHKKNVDLARKAR